MRPFRFPHSHQCMTTPRLDGQSIVLSLFGSHYLSLLLYIGHTTNLCIRLERTSDQTQHMVVCLTVIESDVSIGNYTAPDQLTEINCIFCFPLVELAEQLALVKLTRLMVNSFQSQTRISRRGSVVKSSQIINHYQGFYCVLNKCSS